MAPSRRPHPQLPWCGGPPLCIVSDFKGESWLLWFTPQRFTGSAAKPWSKGGSSIRGVVVLAEGVGMAVAGVSAAAAARQGEEPLDYEEHGAARQGGGLLGTEEHGAAR